jgi:predicted ribosome quality control (RQC) complex YloA/Tae2 family protein
VTVTDYFGETPREVLIQLDPAITLRENIDRMFKRHQKAGRGRQIVVRQIAEVQSRAAAIADRMRRLHAIKDWDTWLAIAGRISAERGRSASPEERAEQGPQRYRTFFIEGYDVSSDAQPWNDELTFQVAAPDDF